MEDNYTGPQKTFLVALRILIGWHFLYEGLLKLLNPEWTSKGYLLSSEGLFSSFFEWLGSDGMINMVDLLTIVLLLLVGFTLMLGIFTRQGSMAGMLLLAFFYLSHPALPGMAQGPAEGNYFIVNKNLIELAALGVIWFFPSNKVFGLEGLFKKRSISSPVNAVENG